MTWTDVLLGETGMDNDQKPGGDDVFGGVRFSEEIMGAAGRKAAAQEEGFYA